MKCIECGHELKDGAVFCIRCGAMQVSKDNTANQASGATVRPAVSNTQGAGARHNTTTTTGKSFKPTPRRSTASVAVPIVAAVAVVAAVGALAMFVMNPASSGQSSSAAATVVASESSSSDSSSSSSSSSSSASSSSSSASSSSASSSASSTSATTSSASSASAANGTANGTTATTNTNNTANGTAANGTTNNNTYTEAPAAQPQQQAEPEPAQTNTGGDSSYYLADTSSRYYSRSEVENMSNYDLYYARNEIFARHGRMFQNSDLQDYFNSKSWYTPLYTPAQWDAMASPLSDVELKNTTLMREVEESRNSPYL